VKVEILSDIAKLAPWKAPRLSIDHRVKPGGDAV
jgi:hypothetical protein